MSANIDQIINRLNSLQQNDQEQFCPEGGDGVEGVFAWRFSPEKVTLGSNDEDDPEIQAILQAARLVNNGEQGMYEAPDGVPFGVQEAAGVIDQLLVATYGPGYVLEA